MNKLSGFIFKVLNHQLFLVCVIAICLYTQGTLSDRYFGWTNPKNTVPENNLTINTDGSGYYAYLPQWFIYSGSPHFSFLLNISKKYRTDKFSSGITFLEKKKGIDKYYIGTSICISPFFLINHWLQNVIGGETDGYAKSYQCTIVIASLFYSFLAILGLIQLLKLFQLSNFVIALMVIFASVGTSVNFYTSFNPSFSHVYSYCAITWLLFFCKKWALQKQDKSIILIGFLLGLIFIIRPTNLIIVILIPFLFFNWKDFTSTLSKTFKNAKSIVCISFLLFISFVFLQMMNVYNQTGKWVLNTYSSEHFDYLFHPKWVEVLFSYEKGFFVYAPLMLLLLPAILWGIFKNSYLTFGFVLFFIVLTYLTSSWWCWWYGGGLGMRPFVDFTSLFILLIALFYNSIHFLSKFIVIIFAVCMIYFYQILQCQFNRNILHYDRVSKDQFWDIFLKTDKRFSWMTHFQEYEIPKFDDFKIIRFVKNEIQLSVDVIDPSIVFIPTEKWRNSHIGLRFEGKMYLTNPESNPSFIIQFFKEGNCIKKSELYIGNKIDDLNVFNSFTKDYVDTLSYANLDSIKLILTKGMPVTKVKNINCIFYSLKSLK